MVISAMILALLVQDQIDNPEFKGWTAFKPGSSVTYKVEVSVNPDGGQQKSTLKSVNETEAVLEVEMTVAGAPAKIQERKVPAKVPAATAPKTVKEGEEEVDAGGKQLKCTTKEFEVKTGNGKAMKMKVWANEEVPGKAAKVEISAEGFRSTMTATSWEKK